MALTSLLGDIVKVVRGKGPGRVKIDNKVFQLHYRLTTFLFLGFSVLVTAYNMLGQPVTCACGACDSNGVPLDVMNTHCWITATYTVSTPLRDYGFQPHYGGIGVDQDVPQRDYQSYYQWVPFMLALHGVLFYVPHWLWVLSEDGRMASMIQDVRLPVLDRGVLRARVANLAIYVRQTLGSYQEYFVRFIICDALNVINVISTIFMIDRFLKGKFLSYGSVVVSYLRNLNETVTPVSPFTTVFPKMAKCDLMVFGSSGSIQHIDGLCVLALNVLNEKVYLVLWFWLIVLSVLSGVVFVGRLVLMMVTSFRVPMLEHKAHFKFSREVCSGVNSLCIGDFFLLSLMARNMDVTAFRLLLKELAKEDFHASFTDDEHELSSGGEETAMNAQGRHRKLADNGYED